MPDSQDAIRRYNQHRMDEAERDAFEARMMGEPALARAVELDALMRDAARDVTRDVEAPRAPPRSAARWVPLAAAASLAAGVLLGRIFTPAASGYSDVVVASLDEVRGSETPEPREHVVTLSKDSLLILDLPGPLTDGEASHLIVSDAATGREIFRLPAAAGSAGVVTVAVPRSRMPDGRYTVHVAGDDRTSGPYSLTVESRAVAPAH